MAKDGKRGLYEVHRAILAVLQVNTNGIDMHGIMKAVGPPHSLNPQFNRRVRELYPHYIIDRRQVDGKTCYFYIGPRPEGSWDYDNISKTDRARILHRDKSRCQMCGRTATEDGVKLHVDHKIPREWGGPTKDDRNLWTLCSDCNEGKKNYFKTFDDTLMRRLFSIQSVHECQ